MTYLDTFDVESVPVCLISQYPDDAWSLLLKQQNDVTTLISWPRLHTMKGENYSTVAELYVAWCSSFTCRWHC